MECPRCHYHDHCHGERCPACNYPEEDKTEPQDYRKCPLCEAVTKWGPSVRHMWQVHQIELGFRCVICGKKGVSRRHYQTFHEYEEFEKAVALQSLGKV